MMSKGKHEGVSNMGNNKTDIDTSIKRDYSNECCWAIGFPCKNCTTTDCPPECPCDDCPVPDVPCHEKEGSQ